RGGRGLGRTQHPAERLACEVDRDLATGQRRIGQQLDDRALELADARSAMLRDELEDLVVQDELVLVGLLPQDRDAGLEVGRLDVGDEPPLESRDQPLFEAGYLLRGPV